MLNTAGSVMTAAISSPRSCITRTKLSGSFQVRTMRVSSSSIGTPGPEVYGPILQPLLALSGTVKQQREAQAVFKGQRGTFRGIDRRMCQRLTGQLGDPRQLLSCFQPPDHVLFLRVMCQKLFKMPAGLSPALLFKPQFTEIKMRVYIRGGASKGLFKCDQGL